VRRQPGLSETPAGWFSCVHRRPHTLHTPSPRVPAVPQTWHRQPPIVVAVAVHPAAPAPAMGPSHAADPRLAAPLAPAAAPPVPEYAHPIHSLFPPSPFKKILRPAVLGDLLLKLILAEVAHAFPVTGASNAPAERGPKPSSRTHLGHWPNGAFDCTGSPHFRLVFSPGIVFKRKRIHITTGRYSRRYLRRIRR